MKNTVKFIKNILVECNAVNIEGESLSGLIEFKKNDLTNMSVILDKIMNTSGVTSISNDGNNCFTVWLN